MIFECNRHDSLGDFVGMIHEQLTMIHAGEDLNVGVGINSEQMFDLRFGSKGFLRAVPEVDISS